MGALTPWRGSDVLRFRGSTAAGSAEGGAVGVGPRPVPAAARGGWALQQCIADVASRAAVVTVAHRLSTVLDTDQIVVVDAGRVRAVGSHAELLASDETATWSPRCASTTTTRPRSEQRPLSGRVC